MNTVIIAVIVVGSIGLFIGIFLSLASVKFKVEVNEDEEKIRAVLPGNNCGACGYPGCDGLACAIAKKEAPINQCPVGGNEVAKKIGEILHLEVEENTHLVAYVKCKGTCDKIQRQYQYDGIHDCLSAAVVPGSGDKKCRFGCMGYGSCVKTCAFDSIHVIDGVAQVDQEKCKSCQKCMDACPQHLIEMVPYESLCHVRCNSHDKGPVVNKNCKAGCLGCMMCQKVCPTGAITVENFLAHIDYSKCVHCGKCKEKCPRKIIE